MITSGSMSPTGSNILHPINRASARAGNETNGEFPFSRQRFDGCELPDPLVRENLIHPIGILQIGIVGITYLIAKIISLKIRQHLEKKVKRPSRTGVLR